MKKLATYFGKKGEGEDVSDDERKDCLTRPENGGRFGKQGQEGVVAKIKEAAKALSPDQTSHFVFLYDRQS